jgi:hypothetical protein
MISSSITTLRITDIPTTWIFEYYGDLPEKLVGQDLKIKSLFNPTERTPSLCIYVNENYYKFKDFSSGKFGTAEQFVMYKYGLTYGEAVNKIVKDYEQHLASGNASSKADTYAPNAKYTVTDYVKRKWHVADAHYWGQFNIGSSLLEEFNVIPVSKIVMEKTEGETSSRLDMDVHMKYLYTRLDGTPYKMYSPGSNKRFLKLQNYIQGTDQLKFEKPNLIITSSLKDIMCLTTFGFNAEYVAPDAETAYLPNGVMSLYKSKYKNIITLFDNDDAGKKAAERYETTYGIPYVILPLSKDPSDSVRDHGLEKTREVLYPLLKEAINK